MELLTAIFQKLLSMALTALPVMAVVLAVRACLRKAPKKYSYVLWLAVGLRLACPLLPESPVGLPWPEALDWTLSETASQQASQAADFPKATGQGSEAAPVPETVPDRTAPAVQRPASTAAPAAENGRSMGWMEAAALVWLAGLGGMLAYIAVSDIRLRRRLDGAVLREDNVWECGAIPTPFVLGLFRPRIYIPFRMTEDQRLYVLAHERHHIRRRDYWAKALALLLLAAYWWDPAAWLCWRLFCRDMEMSCDEAVLARLGDRAKREYSLSLVSFALDRQAPMALAFGEHDAVRRVKNVLNWKKARPAVTFLALAAVALAIAVCGTNAPGGWVRELHTRDGGQYMIYQTAKNTAGVSWYLDIYEDGVLTDTRYLGSGAEDGPQTGTVHIDYQVSERMTSRGRELDSVQLYGEGDIPWAYELSLDPDSHYDMEPESRRPLRGKTARRITVPREGLTVYSLCLSETGKFTEATLGNPLVLQVRLVMTQRGNSWLRAEQNGNGVSFSCELKEPVRSWAVYEDVYENGALVSSLPRVIDTLQEYGGASPRDLRMTLNVPAVYAEGDGFAGTLEVHVDGITWNTSLPRDHYTGMGSVLGDGSGRSLGRRALADNGSAALYTVLLSTRPDGGISLGGTAGNGLLTNDTVVQYRFVTSTQPQPEWETLADGQSGPLEALARTLYAGRGDPEALLSAMEDFEEPLGRCELQDAAGNYLSLLFYDSPVAAEKRSTLMWRYGMVLLALLDDCAATTWNWIDGGVQALPQNDGLWNTDPWLHAHGLSGTIRDYGASPQAVETLLEALYPQSGGGAPVSELGASLFALRGETALLVKAIPERLIGLNGWDLTADGVLELLVARSMGEIADGGEGLMSDASCLLTALLPEEIWAIRWTVDGQPVEFSYAEDHDPGGDLFTDVTAFTWTEHRSGDGLYVRSCGQSAAGMTLLLDELGIGGESLPVQTAETFTDILGYDGFLWQEQWDQGGWSLRTYYAVTAEGTVPIAESFGWGQREDYSVDLDGDGQKELVCNVTFNADGARRAYVYQRRDDGIWQSCVTPEGLPGYENTGIGSSWEEYDPEENLFRIHYHKKGQEDYALAEVRGMEQLEEFYPYS